MIKVATEIGESEWRGFLADYDGASIYHTPEWKHFLMETFHYEPHYLFAKNEAGKVAGFLPLFQIKSRLTGNRLCSLPFSHECGFLGERAALDVLLTRSLELAGELRADYLEIRDALSSDLFQSEDSYAAYLLELSPATEEVWMRCDGSVRRAVKKSRRSGITVAVSENTGDLRAFYELNCIAKKKMGAPCHPWLFFKNLFAYLGDHVSLYIARYGDRIVAGGVMFAFKDRFLYGYGAADPGYLELRTYNAFLWKSIADACLGGYRYYDFGRTFNADLGLVRFKKRWGTVEKKLTYSYYPGNPNLISANRDGIRYKLGTTALRMTPAPIYKKLSEIIFRHLG